MICDRGRWCTKDRKAQKKLNHVRNVRADEKYDSISWPSCQQSHEKSRVTVFILKIIDMNVHRLKEKADNKQLKYKMYKILTTYLQFGLQNLCNFSYMT